MPGPRAFAQRRCGWRPTRAGKRTSARGERVPGSAAPYPHGVSLHAILLLVVASAAVLSLAVVALGGHGDREDEEAAREHFTRTGRWPDE